MEFDPQQLKEARQRVIEQKNREQYLEWCDEKSQISERFEKMAPEWIAEIEPNPYHWIENGLAIINAIKIKDSREAFETMPFPIFLTGAELFLKGMYLCTKEEYRDIKKDSYFTEKRRNDIEETLRKDFGHDLIESIKVLRKLEPYKTNEVFQRFLTTLRGVVFEFYFPLTEKWADARYPYRFYNDQENKAQEHRFYSLPPLSMIQQLFNEAYQEIEKVWHLRALRIENGQKSKERPKTEV